MNVKLGKGYVRGDSYVVPVDVTYQFGVDRLPDSYRGPCWEVLQRDPLLVFVRGGYAPHAKAKRGAK